MQEEGGAGVERRIQAELVEIERARNVRILHAVESGSRAWGFASPDSDYDVRFVYACPAQEYLRLDGPRDVIEWRLDDVLDIGGWDIRKALSLAMKANPALFEWDASPIVYRTTAQWQAVHQVIGRYFTSKAGLHHYLSMARGNYREYLKGETVRLKKYFYVLRPILACRWILHRGTPPPVPFRALVDAELDQAVRPLAEGLLERKAASPELGEGPRLDALNVYIQAQFEALEAAIRRMPPDPRREWSELNGLFFAIAQSGGIAS